MLTCLLASNHVIFHDISSMANFQLNNMLFLIPALLCTWAILFFIHFSEKIFWCNGAKKGVSLKVWWSLARIFFRKIALQAYAETMLPCLRNKNVLQEPIDNKYQKKIILIFPGQSPYFVLFLRTMFRLSCCIGYTKGCVIYDYLIVSIYMLRYETIYICGSLFIQILWLGHVKVK
jgi:hypothetical protein